MSAHPYHPQGFGQHGGFSPADWASVSAARFRNLGKRIKLADLPPDARKAAEAFIRDSKKVEPNGWRRRYGKGLRGKRKLGSKRLVARAA
jgi:hypothetical protein